jgi:hypothetical protein
VITRKDQKKIGSCLGDMISSSMDELSKNRILHVCKRDEIARDGLNKR